MMPDAETVLAILRDVAKAVVLPRFGALMPEDVRRKKHARDLVTVADVEAERALTAALTALVPGSAVVGEEGVAADPAVIQALDRPGAVWIIDPVDGTCNFVDGLAVFALMVAFAVDGETQGGWIYDPVADVAVWAQAGSGAHQTSAAGTERLAIGRRCPIDQMVGSLTESMAKRITGALRSRGGGSPRVVRYGSAGCEYMDLARGRIDFALYGWMKPWDHAAGALIHREAGGYGRLILEPPEPYRPTSADAATPLLLAPDEASWHDLKDLIAPRAETADRVACP